MRTNDGLLTNLLLELSLLPKPPLVLRVLDKTGSTGFWMRANHSGRNLRVEWQQLAADHDLFREHVEDCNTSYLWMREAVHLELDLLVFGHLHVLGGLGGIGGLIATVVFDLG